MKNNTTNCKILFTKRSNGLPPSNVRKIWKHATHVSAVYSEDSLIVLVLYFVVRTLLHVARHVHELQLRTKKVLSRHLYVPLQLLAGRQKCSGGVYVYLECTHSPSPLTTFLAETQQNGARRTTTRTDIQIREPRSAPQVIDTPRQNKIQNTTPSRTWQLSKHLEPRTSVSTIRSSRCVVTLLSSSGLCHDTYCPNDEKGYAKRRREAPICT